uniref:Uncharacterized protein n=2 Tax=Sus scrofa TaxID=9823 RepID=A0A8D1BDP0_PIG
SSVPTQPFHPLFRSEELSQGPEILQDDLVAPGWQGLLAQEATVASVAAEQEEEVGVAVKKFSWQKAVWGPTHRVISATDAQYRYSRLVHIPEWVVVFPVGVPADGETLGVAEEGLLKLSQGAAPEQFSGVHYFLQGRGIPGNKKWNGEGRKERKELGNTLAAEGTQWQPTGQILTTEAFFGPWYILKLPFHCHHLNQDASHRSSCRGAEETIQLEAMRLQVRSLASLSGLSKDPTLL